MSTRGRFIRRYDKNGNPYYVDRNTGRRVTGERWQRERSRIKAREEKQERTKRPKAPPVPVAPPRKPTHAPVPWEPTVSPFPPHVSDTGEPIDDDGFLDDEAFAIEGEDDT